MTRSVDILLVSLDEVEAADAIEQGIANMLASSRVRTPDIKGKSTTNEMGEAIASEVLATHKQNG